MTGVVAQRQGSATGSGKGTHHMSGGTQRARTRSGAKAHVPVLAGLAGLVIAATLLAGWLLWRTEPQATAVATVPSYIGAQSCADCHRAQHEAWKGSQHRLAMRSEDHTSELQSP